MSRERKEYKHRRLVRIGVCIPASIVLEVGTDDDPEPDTDWQVIQVRSAQCDPSVRDVTENMHDADFEALEAAAFNAEDLP